MEGDIMGYAVVLGAPEIVVGDISIPINVPRDDDSAQNFTNTLLDA
jgi:hypothetical protein